MALDKPDQLRNSFPSDFVDPKIKETPEYCIKWAEAVDKRSATDENPFFSGGAGNTVKVGTRQWHKFPLLRSYARGEQPIDKYKPILGVSDKKVANDPNNMSWKVLSWEILGIAPKFVNNLVGKLIGQNNDIGINAIDKQARDARIEKKIELQDYLINQPLFDAVTKATGLGFAGPVQEDVMPMPQNMGEIDTHINMFYKERYCLAVQDMLREINEQDNYLEILKDCAIDLVEVAVGITKTYRVQNRIMRRRCVPERCVSSSSLKDMGDDIKYFGEYWDLTIGQLKELAGDQFTEEEYRKIAEVAGNQKFDSINTSDYYAQYMCYPWDSTKVTVLDLIWFSPDWETHQVGRNKHGNISVTKKDYNWWEKLRNKGVTEQKFNDENESKVIRFKLDNQYQAMWIRGTKFVFNYGKSKDMLKNESDAGKTISPYTIYKLKRSIVDILIPVFDNIQLNWLQYQHHSAKSRPAGLSIEMTALQDLSLAGAGGKAMTPKQALQIYFDTGIILWKRRDTHGNLQNWQPINELQNGINPAAAQHLQFVLEDINLLREMASLNELTDGSTPNSEMGKAVAKMASGAALDGLKVLHHGFDMLNLKTHEKTVIHITGMASSGLAPYYAQAVGYDSVSVINLLKDLTMHQLGCYLMKQPTEEMRARLSGYLAAGIKAGTLREYEAMEIEMEPNIYKAIKLMKMYWGQKQREAEATAQRQMQDNTQAQIASNQAAEEAKMQGLQADYQMQGQFEWEKARAEDWKNERQASREAFLLTVKGKIDAGIALSEAEQDRLTKLAVAERTGQYQLMAASMKPKPTTSKPPKK
jgi:hypothetical protein